MENICRPLPWTPRCTLLTLTVILVAQWHFGSQLCPGLDGAALGWGQAQAPPWSGQCVIIDGGGAREEPGTVSNGVFHQDGERGNSGGTRQQEREAKMVFALRFIKK